MNVKMPEFEQVEDWKRQWTAKYVQVDESRPELKRFAGRTGRVVTVNMSGRALVQFDDLEGWGWGRFDIALPFLRQVAAPAPVEKAKAEKHALAEKPKAEAAGGEQEPAAKMSPLEMMRAKAAAKKPSEASEPASPAGSEEAKPAKKSPLEIMREKAAAKQAAESAPAAGDASAPTTAPAKKSPLEIMREKAAAKKAAEGSAAPAPAAPITEPAPAKKSPLDIIREKAAAKKHEQ